MIYYNRGATIERQSDGALITKDMASADYRDALATGTIQAPSPPTKSELKFTIFAAAQALNFTIDQLRVIRAIVMLMNGTPQQKTKAAALLQPLVKIAGDARRISDQIDADLPPDVLVPPTIPTDDP